MGVRRRRDGGLYVVFVGLHGRYGAPWRVWSESELASLANINALAVASLIAFLGWGFSGLSKT